MRQQKNANKIIHTSTSQKLRPGPKQQPPPTQIAITSFPDVQSQQTIHPSKAKNKGYMFRLLEFQLRRLSSSLKQRARRKCKTTILCILLIFTIFLVINQHENCMAPISCINLLVDEFFYCDGFRVCAIGTCNNQPTQIDGKHPPL